MSGLRLDLHALRAEIVDSWQRVEWPVPSPDAGCTPRVAVVTVNSNTREFLARLLFSLCRTLPTGSVQAIVVVDNGSRDGSVELLRQLADARLIHLIENDLQRYHGPALNQALSYLARARREHSSHSVDYVWILDSDVIVLRPDALARPLFDLRAANAALVGQFEYVTLAQGYAELWSLLVDPARAWRLMLPPFYDEGAPARRLQVSLRILGVPILSFPYCQEEYILHAGGGALLAIASGGVVSNKYFAWAHEWRELLLSGFHEGRGKVLYRRFDAAFRREIPVLTAANLVRACRVPARIRVWTQQAPASREVEHAAGC
jgi:glycosyltransferase involved in cell wall biosynthesis